MLRSAGARIKKGPMAKTAAPPSVLEPQCPSRLVLDRIADKWTALVIQILAGGTMRYAELQRAIGITHRSASEDLNNQRSEEHTSELQSPYDLVCRLLLEKKKKN